jgi:two-component system, response regulator YesN
VAIMYKLLLVDDESGIRHGVSHYFPWDEHGFTIVGETENGADALDFLEKTPVDVILCDIKMPVKSGLELARELYMANNKTKIVFLTGYKDFDLVKEALVYGAADYLVKPTKYKELSEVFTRLKEELDRDKREKLLLHEDDDNAANDNLLIRKIKAYVEEHYSSACLNDVAEIVHMNPYYVSAYFKKKTGHSFSAYINEVKMKKAAEYLANPYYKTYQISELIGYGNPKNFSKAFKAFYGKTPREFRN